MSPLHTRAAASCVQLGPTMVSNWGEAAESSRASRSMAHSSAVPSADRASSAREPVADRRSPEPGIEAGEGDGVAGVGRGPLVGDPAHAPALVAVGLVLPMVGGPDQVGQLLPLLFQLRLLVVLGEALIGGNRGGVLLLLLGGELAALQHLGDGGQLVGLLR